MTDSSLISVIIPVYNGARFIAEAINSVRQQGYSPLEIIIVDDGSTDETAKVVAGLGDDIHYVHQSNRGPAAARNTGLKLAAGKFIAFLDADDLWPANKLQIQTQYLLNHPKFEFVLGRIQYVRLPGAQETRIQLDENNSLAFIHLGSGVYRASAFAKVGLFDESLRFSEDHDWFLRARELGLSFTILEQITLHYRLHGQNMTSNKNANDFQLLEVLKKSLDRRRKQNKGVTQTLPKFLDFESAKSINHKQ